MLKQGDLEKKFEALSKSTPAEWVVRMNEHFSRTGGYRTQDVRRVLGDQSRRVEIGGTTDVAASFRST